MSSILIPIIALASIVIVVWAFLYTDRSRRQSAYREKSMQNILPNKLQAYERLTLYMERIRPASMAVREQMRVNTTFELHSLLLDNIQKEFEHNIAMQIYISSSSWARILRAREEIKKMLTNIAKETNPKASSLEYARKVIERSKDECDFYVDRAIEGFRRDLNGMFVNE